jgi:hypothetical protein
MAFSDSSLQRALASSSRAPSQKGSFEREFAGGLDLSEFSNNPHSKDDTSASASLLRVKLLESKRKEQEELEEKRIQDLLEQKQKRINEEAKCHDGDVSERRVRAVAPQNKNTSTDLHLKGGTLEDALVSMHHLDRSNSSIKMKRSKRLPVRRSSTHSDSSRKRHGAVSVHKTARRSKHSR